MPLRFPRLRINRLWLSLGAALVLGLLAAFLSTSYLKNREQRIAAELAQKAKGGPTIAVAVPTRDMTKGASLDQRSVAAREVAADLLYDERHTKDRTASPPMASPFTARLPSSTLAPILTSDP